MASSASKRYAQAVFSLGKERGTLEAWQADLATMTELMTDERAASFFANPGNGQERKLAVLDNVLQSAQPEARNLARLLLERGRLAQAPEMAEMFDALLLAERGIAIADVTTAEPLSDTAREMVRERLQRLVGKQIELRLTVDPSIIGGIVARVGDTLIDGSVVSQLRKLRTRLASAS